MSLDKENTKAFLKKRNESLELENKINKDLFNKLIKRHDEGTELVRSSNEALKESFNSIQKLIELNKWYKESTHEALKLAEDTKESFEEAFNKYSFYRKLSIFLFALLLFTILLYMYF